MVYGSSHKAQDPSSSRVIVTRSAEVPKLEPRRDKKS
jgi:hypothetical protein